MTPTGLERLDESSGKSPVSARGGAKSDAIGAHAALIDADLRAIIDAWPTLPEADRRAVLAIIHASRVDLERSQ